MNRILFTFIGLLFCAGSVNAQQFVAVKVEAEDFASKHSDWRLTTNSNTPNVNPDPDGSHAGSASGRAYMELLPDTRVTHSDPLVSGRNFWNTPGTGPSLSYNVNVPESGRYLVYVKAYSTGTEDNGIHVGLNGSNPNSGARMQWCSGKNQWTWGSAQRTDSNHCGVERTIFLDFAFAGANTVTFSAREDGFEFDQFILLKTSNNSCAPNSNDQIACNTGTTNIQAETPVVSTPQPAPQPAPAPQPEPEPEPEPVIETPVAVVVPEVVQPVPQATAPAGLPACASADSDPDGDGFGWENNQSCIVTAQASPAASTTPAAVPAAQTTTGGLPVCQSADSDPDGDGFGWENNQSCVVTGTSSAASATSATPAAVTAPGTIPTCSSSASDSDGDGWGWENSQSCLVQ